MLNLIIYTDEHENGKVKGLKSVVKIVWSNLKGLVPTFKEKGTQSNMCIC